MSMTAISRRGRLYSVHSEPRPGTLRQRRVTSRGHWRTQNVEVGEFGVAEITGPHWLQLFSNPLPMQLILVAGTLDSLHCPTLLNTIRLLSTLRVSSPER